MQQRATSLIQTWAAPVRILYGVHAPLTEPEVVVIEELVASMKTTEDC